MEVYRRSSWLLLIFGITLLATALQGVQGEAESEGPSESECQQFIEKALKKLEIGEAAIHTTDTSDIPDIPETKQTTESKENSKEDVPTVEITTDDSDHNDGEDDMHEDKEEKVEEATESSELENILNKNQESKETKDEKSTEKTEEEKSAEETEVIDTETHKSNENEQESDTSQQKSQEEETKDDEKDENLEEKEEEEEEKEEAEAEDIDEPSGEVTDKSDEHPSKEDLKEESVETVTETKSAEVTKKEKIIAEEPSKPLESEPTQKKNKWWNLEELEEAKRELEEKQKQEAEAIPKRKKNKWWNIEESEETETIEEEPKPVEEPVKGKNKWWNLDEMEEAIIEKKEEPKIEQSKTEEPTQKKNKWWNLEELAEAQAEAKAKEEEVAKVEMTVKKKNKWWRTESDEDTHEETVKETIEESKIQKREAEPPQPPRKKNKWWKLESGEVEEPEPIEKKEEDIKIETEAPRKKNKWWNVDEIEKEEEKHEEKVVEKIEPEQPRKKNKWWKYDDESSEVEIQKLIKEKPVEKPSTPPSTPPHPKNKWWKSDSGEVDEIKIEKVEKDKTVTTEEPKRPKNKWWKSESEEAEMKDEQEKQKLWKVEKTEQVIKDQERIFMTLGQSKESDEEIEHESREESEPAPEEDLGLDIEIPSELRPRDHVEKLLKLDDKSSDAEAIVNRIAETTLKELKRLYEQAIKPLEVLYKYRDLSNRHFGDSEIFSKPLILFMGPWSGGKSSIINYLLNNEYNETSLRTGAEPSPAYFNILMYGNEPEILDGTQLVADFTFSGLQKFGQGLEERLRGLKLPSKLLEKVNIVEIPGILEVRKQVSRMFPFNDACQWFIDRADIIFLVYDPSKLDVGPETEAILDQLKGREHQTRIILNKADQIKPEELLRVQGALIWNISPLMSSAQPPIMYTTSLWSKPYESWAPVRLLQAQERSFLRDLRSAIDKRIDNKIASARRFAVRVRNHAKMVDCYLTTYYNHKSVFGNRKIVSDEIIEHPQNYHIYEGLSTLTNISRYDLPDPDVYRDFFKLNPLYDFQQLSSTCTYFRGCPINRLDVSIAYDLPELVGKHKRIIENSLNENSNDNKLNDNNPTTVPTS